MRTLLIAAAALLATACGSSSPTEPAPAAKATATPPATATPAPGRFDEAKAWSLIKLQVAAGQRPAGSPQLRRVASQLRKRMPGGRFVPIPGQPGLRNVVARLPGVEREVGVAVVRSARTPGEYGGRPTTIVTADFGVRY